MNPQGEQGSPDDGWSKIMLPFAGDKNALPSDQEIAYVLKDEAEQAIAGLRRQLAEARAVIEAVVFSGQYYSMPHPSAPDYPFAKALEGLNVWAARHKQPPKPRDEGGVGEVTE